MQNKIPQSVKKASLALFKWDHERPPNKKDYKDLVRLLIFQRMAEIVLESAGKLKKLKNH